MVEKRKVSFEEAGLTVPPGKEVWGRIANDAYTKKCAEILEAEAKNRPLYRVSMTVDHGSKNVVFEYFPIDWEFESKMRKVNQIMQKAKFEQLKKDFGVEGKVRK